MQTRRQQEQARASARLGLQDSPPEGYNLNNNGGVTVKDQVIEKSAAGLLETQANRQEVVSAVVIPEKRKKPASSSANKTKKIEIPHSAKLPRIVWIYDDKYQWWPGKITKYPPVDNKATVSRFGNTKPKTLTVECSESNILPFGDKPQEHQLSRNRTTHSEAFEAALKQASEAQIADDDDLPGWDEVMNELSTTRTPAIPVSAPSALKENQRKMVKTESIYMPDTSLTIPGELVLAWADRFYYPGRISSFNNKSNKYKIDFATGHSSSVERKKFFTRYEKGFQTCPLGELALPSFADYRDTELESQVCELYPILYDIIAGKHDEAGRLKAFMEGGKARRSLAQRVGPGSFGRGEYGLISALLQSEFLPDLATTRKPVTGTVITTTGIQAGATRGIAAEEAALGPPMKREGDVTQDFSDQMRLHFVTDVLLPETITRLTMRRNNISYSEADKQGLSLAEQLCSQAREELDACQSHSYEIEKIYSKLCFVSRQIKVQITRDLNNVSMRMDHALHALRNKEVDPEIQKARQEDKSLSHKPTVLFDFLDEASLQRLLDESGEHMQRIRSTTDRLQDLRADFKGYLNNAIPLDESALTFAREKMQLQEQQTYTMAESLVSLANHYDQVTQVLTADIQPMQEELDVLESDTAEVLVIIEELEESLTLVQATRRLSINTQRFSEAIGVQERQYATAYQEAVAFFKKIEALEPELAQLVEVFKLSETLEEDFDATEKLTSEINSLAIWYEEFHNSYGALTVEIVRRHKAHEARQRLVNEFIDRMEASYEDEMHNRAVFSERHGKFLPVDLCPAFADAPVQYEVISHGEWLLPMPTPATLKLTEGHSEFKG
ncbi:autophagy protein 17 [Mortierella sp. AD010]|nr:autophagy protein 17 [Mortierella sp. AD010]